MPKAMGSGRVENHIANHSSWLMKTDIFYRPMKNGTNFLFA
jgi:hypothetical protein